MESKNQIKKVAKKSNGSVVGIALAGVAAAAAAGTYFLYGTKVGAKQRKKVSSLALKAKAEVLEKIEKLKEVNEEKYADAVKSVIKKYQKIKKDHGPEVEALSKELLGYWKNIKSQISPKISKTKTKSKAKK